MNKYLISFIALILFSSFAIIFYGCGATHSGSSPQPVGSIVSITVTPSSSVVAIGSTQQFNAQARYADGTVKSINPTWSVSANLGSISTSGLFTGSTKGYGLITATKDNKSGNASIVVSLSPPGTPTGLSSTNVDNNTTTLSWTTVTDAVSYIISYGTDEAATNVGTLSASSTSKNIAGLKYGTKYYVKALAVNADGDFGAFSNIYNFTTNAVWVTSTVDNVGDVGYINSINTDSNDKVHIVHTVMIDEPTWMLGLKYTTNSSGTWQTEIIDSGKGIGYFSDSAIGKDDKVNIIYGIYNPNVAPKVGQVWYAKGNYGAFITEEVFSNILCMWYSIKLDDNDKVHGSYYFGAQADPFISTEDLYYFTNAGGSWVSEEVMNDSNDVSEYSLSLALNNSGSPFIAYCNNSNVGVKTLKYAIKQSSVWIKDTANSTDKTGRFCSIAIDSQDCAHISYYYQIGAGEGELWYSNNKSVSWEKITIDDSVDQVGEWTSIAIDSMDYVHIAYYDSTNNALKYATNRTGTWVTKTIDDTIDVGEWISLAIDSNDGIHIAYRNRTSDDLKYAVLK